MRDFRITRDMVTCIDTVIATFPQFVDQVFGPTEIPEVLAEELHIKVSFAIDGHVFEVGQDGDEAALLTIRRVVTDG